MTLGGASEEREFEAMFGRLSNKALGVAGKAVCSRPLEQEAADDGLTATNFGDKDGEDDGWSIEEEATDKLMTTASGDEDGEATDGGPMKITSGDEDSDMLGDSLSLIITDCRGLTAPLDARLPASKTVSDKERGTEAEFEELEYEGSSKYLSRSSLLVGRDNVEVDANADSEVRRCSD